MYPEKLNTNRTTPTFANSTSFLPPEEKLSYRSMDCMTMCLHTHPNMSISRCYKHNKE